MTKKFTQYTRENGYAALPHLVKAAQEHRLLTYKEIAGLIGRHHRAAAYFLGFIRDEICTPRNIPLINVIVVNGQSRLPGADFLAEGTRKLNKREYKQKAREYQEKVFNYPNWNSILQDLGLPKVE